MIFFAFLEARFNYWKVEKNEIYYKSGILANIQRFPIANLRYDKEIYDIFQFIALRSGKFTLFPEAGKAIVLDNVLNVNKKAKQLDKLLSQIRVKVVNQP